MQITKILKFVLSIILCSLCFVFTSCDAIENLQKQIEDINARLDDLQEKYEESYNQEESQQEDGKMEDLKDIIIDKNYETGFYFSYSPTQCFHYNGKITDHASHKWSINQEGSLNMFDSKSIAEIKDDYYVYTSPNNSKIVKINTKEGKIYLELNASKDYTSPRVDGQGWPHLLVCQNYDVGHSPTLDKLNNLKMKMNFTLKKFSDEMVVAANPGLHACQFSWYITVQNMNPDSDSFLDYFWFGLPFFDNRTPMVGQSLHVDAGKDTATGKAIYNIDISQVIDTPVVVGKNFDIDYDILPLIKRALKSVQDMKEINFLKDATLADLRVMHTNFGWEMPGTYDAAIQVDSVSIVPIYK